MDPRVEWPTPSIHLDISTNPNEDGRARGLIKPLVAEYESHSHFSPREVECILYLHYKLTNGWRDSMDRQMFGQVVAVLFQITSEDMIERVYSAIDTGKASTDVDPEAWLNMWSIFCRGTTRDKISFAYGVYDTMSSGNLPRLKIEQLTSMMIHPSRIRGERDRLSKLLADILLRRLDRNDDGGVDISDLRQSVTENLGLLQSLGRCLPNRDVVGALMSAFLERVTNSSQNPFVVARVSLLDDVDLD